MRRLLALILFVTLSLGSAQDAAEPPVEVVGSQAFGVTVTCSARLPTGVVGCFIERPVLVLGAFEVALGVDAQASFTHAASGHLAPYLLTAWYSDSWSAWAEVRLPELDGLQPLGDPDWLRLGITLRL